MVCEDRIRTGGGIKEVALELGKRVCIYLAELDAP